MKILLIEDEKLTRITLSNTLKQEGYKVINSATGKEGVDILKDNIFDVVITDLRLPQMNGLDILKLIKDKTPETEVIVITAFATVETAVEALKAGAYDYLTKPFSPEKLLSMLSHIERIKSIVLENKKLKDRLKIVENRSLIGQSQSMKQLSETIKVVSKNNYTVLIEGESGTGKEITARALHQFSTRSKKPFLAVNCAAIPESLLESELFGHEKGAFTGASKLHKGYFERADQGTIFIDDIDDFPISLQVKLLRVLQEREIVRVGGDDIIKVDVRIIAATKVFLKQKVKENKFREDLFYRLNIIPLKIPPLSERKEDIPLLIEHFLNKRGKKFSEKEFPKEFFKKLINYNWPGNVRELENIVERVLALSDISNFDPEMLLPKEIENENIQEISSRETELYPKYDIYMLKKDKEIIDWAMSKARNNISEAARLLGLPRSTLRSKLEKH